MVSETGGSGAHIGPAWTADPAPSKSHWRPPVYNAEDYVAGLSRRCGSPPASPVRDEMSLRQFSSVSDLLGKLAGDLRAAYPSFVQEFVGPSLDGGSQLLETLRAVQVSQGPRRQCLLDELACLQCLSACFRCQETPLRLAQSSSGLFSLAACIMSNLNKSRILALQILRKICEETDGKGFSPVSDAMSTMRLRFGEPVRFKFLCGMLAGAPPDLVLAGLAFLNSFLEAADAPQARLYIQAELDQAGFSTHLIVKTLAAKSPCAEEIRSELSRWERLHVDVKRLKSREGELLQEVHQLRDRVKLLERRLQMLQDEKSVMSSSESRLKSRCVELEREVSSLRGGNHQGASTPAEDEGISSSGQDDGTEREPLVYEVYSVNNNIIIEAAKPKNEEETTIDEVIEELQNIINDAETDYNKDSKDLKKERDEKCLAKYYTKYLQRSSNDLSSIHNSDDHEIEIIPTKLVPHPPRRSRSLFFEKEYCNNYMFFEEDESSFENSDSLLSASNEQMQYFECPSKNHFTVQQKEVYKNSSVRRRETFHYTEQKQNANVKPSIYRNNSNCNNRRGSLDGVFHYTTNNTIDSSTKSSTRIYIEGNENFDKRVKSKSLDRIRDGLDTMVDIVVTDNAPIVKPVALQRCGEGTVRKSEESVRYGADRTVFLPIRSEPSAAATAQSFLLKRGRLNAGLYSGQVNRSAAPAPEPSPSVTTTINISDYYNKSLNGLNLSVSGKLTDLPSGLY